MCLIDKEFPASEQNDNIYKQSFALASCGKPTCLTFTKILLPTGQFSPWQKQAILTLNPKPTFSPKKYHFIHVKPFLLSNLSEKNHVSACFMSLHHLDIQTPKKKIISSLPSILAFKGQALRGNPNHTIRWRSPIPGFRYDFPPKAILRAFKKGVGKTTRLRQIFRHGNLRSLAKSYSKPSSGLHTKSQDQLKGAKRIRLI